MFDRFAIVGAYYLYMSIFGISAIPRRHLRSRAVHAFKPGLTFYRAVALGNGIAFGQNLPKADDYLATRDAYARLLRRARRSMRPSDHLFVPPRIQGPRTRMFICELCSKPASQHTRG